MFIIPLSGIEPLQSAMRQSEGVPGQNAIAGAPFAQSLSNAIANLEQTQQVSQQDAYDLAMGQTDNLHALQINSIKSTVAVDMMAGVTSRVLTAYNEIMRMQV